MTTKTIPWLGPVFEDEVERVLRLNEPGHRLVAKRFLKRESRTFGRPCFMLITEPEEIGEGEDGEAEGSQDVVVSALFATSRTVPKPGLTMAPATDDELMAESYELGEGP